MGRATSVKENSNLSVLLNLYAACPGSITCAYLRAGVGGANVICLGADATCSGAGWGWGASGNAVAGSSLAEEALAAANMGWAKPALVQTRVMQARRHKRCLWIRKFVKKPLPVSSLPSVYARPGPKAGWMTQS
jgi:hypothetical protein